MPAIRRFLEAHPIAGFFGLTFAISWTGFLAAVGPEGFESTRWQGSPRFPLAVMAMLAGPSVSGLLLTHLLQGTAGLREIGASLLRWRVGPGWYAVAILPAPLLAGLLLWVLSIRAPILVSEDRLGVLLAGLAAGATTVLEEIGWTGFAVPRIRRRHGIAATGVLVGVPWGMWHLLQGLFVSRTYVGDLPLASFVALNTLAAVSQLTAYRVLLVWLHARTSSLLMVTLMHASLTASTIFIFTPLATGPRFLAHAWGLAAALWVVVAVVLVRRERAGGST